MQSSPSRPDPSQQRFRSSRATRLVLAAAVSAWQLVFAMTAHAGDVVAHIVDGGGNAVPDAVLSLHGDKPAAEAPTGSAVMDQHSKQFDPHVLAVRTNTSVSFPNSDDIHHEVYSFSKAKTFELPLYHGSPASPIAFDKPGLVVLGCNIHDNMLGYIYVVDSPWFATSDATGHAKIAAVPGGSYRAKLWYPGLTESAALLEQDVVVPASGPVRISFDNAQRETRAASPTTTRSWNERRANH